MNDPFEKPVTELDLAREQTRRWTSVGEIIAAVAFSALALGGLYLHIQYSGWLIFFSLIIIWRRFI